MERSSFIKGMIGLLGVATLPIEAFSEYKKVYIKQLYISGFQYYEGPSLIEEMNKSGLVELVREPQNKHDKRAIAIYFNGHKIGYLPRISNKTMSILMDTELLEFHAEISHIEPEANTWEQIEIAVYVLKEIKRESDLDKIRPYTALKTSHHLTFLSENNTVMRLWREVNEEEISC